MSDDKLDLKLNLDVDVHDAEKAKALREELARIDAELTAIGKHTNDSLKALGSMARAVTGLRSKGSASDAGARAAVEGERDLYAELRKRFAFERRMASQRKAEESESARAAREEAREVESRFRAQMAWNSRIAAQRAREEKAAESEIQREVRETGRMRDREARKTLADARALRREQEKATQQVRTGAGQVRAGAGRAVAVGGTAAAASVYTANRTVAALTKSGVDLDKALNANTRLSGLSPKDADAKGKDLVKQAAPIARQLGIRTSEYLSARAEALQAGVDEALVDAVTEFGSKYARLNDINPSEVMESSGYGITALGAFGKLSADKIKQLFNLQQHLAATTAASRTGLSSFVRRGLSAGAAAGFSLEDTLAFGGAATSSGADGESASRMLSSVTERLASMPTRAAGISRKKHKSPKDYLIMQLPRKLGFGSWKALKEGLSKDAAGTMEGIYEGLAAITDPRARLEASEEIFGKEFGSVHAGMAVGHRFRKMRKSVRSKEAGNAIDSGMSIRSGSFDFIMDQIGSTVQSLKDGLGMVLKPFWSDLRDWAIQTPRAFDGFNEAFRQGLTGLLSGLGSGDGTMSGLLRSWFGDPGSFSVNAAAIGSFAKGIGTGIREIGSAISSFVRVFAGANASPEQLGQWTARLLGLSAALLAGAPAVAVIAGLTTAITGLVTSALGAWRLLKGAGLVGVGAGATGAVGSAVWATAGRMIGVGFLAEIAQHFNVLKPDGKRGILGNLMEEFVPAPLRRWLDGSADGKSGSGGWVDPPMRKPVEKLTDSLDKTREAVEQGAKIQKQAYQDSEFRSLIHKASFSSVGDAVSDSIRSTARTALSGVVGGGDGPAIAHSNPGGSLGNGLTGMRRRGIIGGGGGRGGGGVPAIPDSVPMTAAERNQLGLILQHESGGRNVMNGVGARNGVSPTAARGYTAQGYYQILNSNWRHIAPGLGINTPNAMASTFEEQTRVAHHLLRNGGIGNWSNYNPKLRAALARGDQAQFAVPGGANGGTLQVGGGSGRSQARMEGQVDVEGTKYDFGSGGHRGANSIPAGTYPITPDAIGPWGRSHGAIGINGNRIWDSTLNRFRDGIEFHAASNGRKITAGCIGIAREQYGQFKAHVMDVIRRQGRAYLTVAETGRASITGGSPAVTAAKASEKGLQDIGDGMKSSGWKKDDPAMRPGGDLSGKATSNAPGTIGSKAPLRGDGQRMLGGGASGGGGSTVHAPINIHGAHHTPEELANTVQRKIQESMNRRTHDYDTFA